MIYSSLLIRKEEAWFSYAQLSHFVDKNKQYDKMYEYKKECMGRLMDRLRNHGFINHKFAGKRQVYGIGMEED